MRTALISFVLAPQQPERVAAMRAKLEELLKNAAPPGHLGLQ